MAVLDVPSHWQPPVRVTPDEPKTAETTPGEGEQATPASTTPVEKKARDRAEKPMLFFITDPADETENEKTEKIAFDPDKVRVGTYYFRCMKLTKDEAEKDPVLADSGRKFPRIVLVSMDWEVEEVIDGRISSSKIYHAMQKLAKLSWEGNFDRNVKGVLKVLADFDKIAKARKVIADKEARDPNAAEQRKIAKEKEDLDKQEKDLQKQRDELLKPEVRQAA